MRRGDRPRCRRVVRAALHQAGRCHCPAVTADSALSDAAAHGHARQRPVRHRDGCLDHVGVDCGLAGAGLATVGLPLPGTVRTRKEGRDPGARWGGGALPGRHGAVVLLRPAGHAQLFHELPERLRADHADGRSVRQLRDLDVSRVRRHLRATDRDRIALGHAPPLHPQGEHHDLRPRKPNGYDVKSHHRLFVRLHALRHKRFLP